MTTEHAGSGNVHRSMELLWDLCERPSRGPKPGLTLETIVTAAVEIADAEGLEALSMRRVATHLGVGTMSLYRYIPGKSELLDLMLDHVLEMPDGVPDMSHLGWREFLERTAREQWQLCMSHPWYPFVDQARPLLGPNGLETVEYVFRHLRPMGLSDQEMAVVITSLSNFVESTARVYINEKQAEERTGISNDEFWAAQAPALDEAMKSGQFPVMADLAGDTWGFTSETVFEFGLQRFLDGLESFLARRSSADHEH
ncbi:TetR/AcrR family transcriptional regulator [Actinobacteria bacterium YIM 96077]|uniref:TetR family transcriptional regulator n=1 Tax=Phytoactinopolyspora halophila TaxID=1981511 RepID=A0A329R1J6_9ACTN|nr:TetR/AcrR family transcriptional regulator [Phytoactinopolyspora halophila]AYY11737.1 TetR/AcrR family transcriptional regulator [Actinobacteria bacterium YIM 96077]RAW17829.1 TetR family transcriptional regulator [Phytoactinopolyspora halophila]